MTTWWPPVLPAPHGHHEPSHMRADGCGILDHEHPACPATKLKGAVSVLLQRLRKPHFFCALHQVVQLACSHTFPNGLVMCFTSVLLAHVSLSSTLYSSAKIVSSILQSGQLRGGMKHFHRHVTPLHGLLSSCTILGVYLSSAATHSSYSSATASVMYNVVTPVLNPPSTV